MKKSLLLVASLALAGLANASTVADMVISRAATVNGQKISAGKYLIEVKGNTATFTNMMTAKSVTATVKVQKSEEKFDLTAAECTDTGNGTKINSIELGGSNTKIELGE